MEPDRTGHGQARRGRIAGLDIARTVALVAMAVYHFTYDLEMFGYLPEGTAVSGGFAVFARTVAASFLFLVGVSLYLAHAAGIRWRPYLRRLLVIALAAGLITAATAYALPDSYIFFGILHSIAVASVLGLAFLRLPAWLVLLAAALVVAARPGLQTGLFDAPWLAWLGLTTWHVRSIDFVPVFPWFGATLAGIGAAGLLDRMGIWDRLRQPRGAEGGVRRLLAWPGRHSLGVYLIHQPVLIGTLWLVTRFLR